MAEISPTARALCAAVLLTLAMMPGDASADEAQEAWGKGNAACLRGDFNLAVRYYTDSIRFNPRVAATYNNRGYAYLQKGDSGKAITDYDEAIRLDPKYAKAYFFRGSGYENKGDQDKAVADYTAAIRLDPKYARAYCNRGPAAKEATIPEDGHAQRAEKGTGARAGVLYFIASTGDDRSPGTIEQPFATLYRAHQVVRAGDTVNLRAGTYQTLISWRKGGTAAAPITIQAYNGEDVTLHCSERYETWTAVKDPTFGDCWKVAIPELPIQYPGLQHTVWEDASNAVVNPRTEIFAIVKGGYMCAPMNAAADFAHPQTATGLLLTDKDGKLIHDITWYDKNTRTLWFKPGPSRVTDPNRELYVTSTRSGQFSLAGSYVRLNGLKFHYLYFIHQQDNPTGCDISSCEIKHASQGIVGGGTRCTYTSLLVDKIGEWLTWRNGGYDRGYLSHGFYFNGSRCVISNCFFGRSNKGGPIQNYPDGVTENLFDNNALYNSDGGSIFMGNSRNYITNNISLQKTYGMGPYINMRGFNFRNNYSEAAYPFGFTCQEAKGAYIGTFEKFAITGNVFNNRGGWIDYRGNIMDAVPCKIDGNVYLGTQRWFVGLTQANPPLTGHKDCTSYASYVIAIQALPHCATWEKNSQASSAAAQFDFPSFDAFLDSDPPLESVLLRIRQYVRGFIAPFPGAGPAICE